MKIQIRRRLVVNPITAWFTWRAYDAAFRPVNLRTPCRQSFHLLDFLRVMIDPRYVKLFVEQDGRPVGLAVVTCHLALLPWVSASYFYEGEEFKDHRVVYVPIIAVRPERQGASCASALMRELRRVAEEEMGADRLCFDTSSTVNPALAAMIARVAGADITYRQLDAQTYYVLERCEDE